MWPAIPSSEPHNGDVLLILSEPELRVLVDADAAREAVARGFIALHQGTATLSGVITLSFRQPPGTAHIKAGHLHEDPVWVVKVAADFAHERTGATHLGGAVLVFDCNTGALVALLMDNGYLTELRTGAAGALAAQLLARADAHTVAIIGAGTQARYQLEALVRVRSIEVVHVYSRTRGRAEAFVDEIARTLGLRAEVHRTAAEAVLDADVIVTTTPSQTPVLQAEWIRPGSHITAVGADEPRKNELSPELLGRAALLVVDDRAQAADRGELRHALQEGIEMPPTITFGELLTQTDVHRARDDITIADLTGIGVQDAAVAHVAVQAATGKQST